MALITCQDAAFAYDGQIVVSQLNFSVSNGDYLCVVGENGSGKSTLLKGILRLLTPVKGKIIMEEGLDAHQIGYLPQQNQNQKDFPASVREVVQSGVSSGKLFLSRQEKNLAEKMMKLMEIDALGKRSFMELSGGQKQRVLLARALCATKKIMLLDEPAAGLDPLVAREMYRVIQRINQEEGIAIIMISHDIQSAILYASHILHLQQTPLFYGRTSDYVQSAAGQRFVGA